MRRGTPAAILFGELLHDIRIERGMTMRQVGEKLGAPAATVSQAEKGKRAVGLSRLILLFVLFPHAEEDARATQRRKGEHEARRTWVRHPPR